MKDERESTSCYIFDVVMPCSMAIKQYDEAFARLLHCASYGYRSGVRKGPFNEIGRFFEELGRQARAPLGIRMHLHRGVRDGVAAFTISSGSLL